LLGLAQTHSQLAQSVRYCKEIIILQQVAGRLPLNLAAEFQSVSYVFKETDLSAVAVDLDDDDVTVAAVVLTAATLAE
jgi:hypothetical protein